MLRIFPLEMPELRIFFHKWKTRDVSAKKVGVILVGNNETDRLRKKEKGGPKTAFTHGCQHLYGRAVKSRLVMLSFTGTLVGAGKVYSFDDTLNVYD